MPILVKMVILVKSGKMVKTRETRIWPKLADLQKWPIFEVSRNSVFWVCHPGVFTSILVLCMLESLDFCFYRLGKLSILVLQGRNPVLGSRNMHQMYAGNSKLRNISCRMVLLMR